MNIQGGLVYTIFASDEVVQNKEHPLHCIADTIDALDQLADGVAVLPGSMMKIFEEGKYGREFRRRDYFDDTGEREALGQAPAIEDVLDLHAEIRRCTVEQEHEAAWNLSAHWPLARSAIKLSTHYKSLELKSM